MSLWPPSCCPTGYTPAANYPYPAQYPCRSMTRMGPLMAPVAARGAVHPVWGQRWRGAFHSDAPYQSYQAGALFQSGPPYPPGPLSTDDSSPTTDQSALSVALCPRNPPCPNETSLVSSRSASRTCLSISSCRAGQPRSDAPDSSGRQTGSSSPSSSQPCLDDSPFKAEFRRPVDDSVPAKAPCRSAAEAPSSEEAERDADPPRPSSSVPPCASTGNAALDALLEQMTRAARELPDELCREEKSSLMRRARALRESRGAPPDPRCPLGYCSSSSSARDAAYSSASPMEVVRFLDRPPPARISPAMSCSRIPLPNQSDGRDICAISNSLECVRSSTVLQGTVPSWFSTPSPMLQELCVCSDTMLAASLRSTTSAPNTNGIQDKGDLYNVSKESIGIASIVPGSAPTPPPFPNTSESNDNHDQCSCSCSCSLQTVACPTLISSIVPTRASQTQEEQISMREVCNMLGLILDKISAISPEILPPRSASIPCDCNSLRNSFEILKCSFDSACAGQDGLSTPSSDNESNARRDSGANLKNVSDRVSSKAIEGPMSKFSSAPQSGTQSVAQQNSYTILNHILDNIVTNPSKSNAQSEAQRSSHAILSHILDNIAPNPSQPSSHSVAQRQSEAILSHILDSIASNPSETNTNAIAQRKSEAILSHILDKIVPTFSESKTSMDNEHTKNSLHVSYSVLKDIVDRVEPATYPPPELFQTESSNEISDPSELPDSEHLLLARNPGGSSGTITLPKFQVSQISQNAKSVSVSQTSQNANSVSEDTLSQEDEPCRIGHPCPTGDPPEACPPSCPAVQSHTSDSPNEGTVPEGKSQSSSEDSGTSTPLNAPVDHYKSSIALGPTTQPKQTGGTVPHNSQANTIYSKRSQHHVSPTKTGCNINQSTSGKSCCKLRSYRERDSSTQARPATYRRLSSKQTSPPCSSAYCIEKVETPATSEPVPGAQNFVSTGCQTESFIYCSVGKCRLRYASESPDPISKETIVGNSSQTVTNEASIVTAEQDSNRVFQPRRSCLCTIRRMQNTNGKKQTTELQAKPTDPVNSSTSGIPILSPKRSPYDDSINAQIANSRSSQHQRNKKFITRCSPNRHSPTRPPKPSQRCPDSCDVGVCTDQCVGLTSSAGTEDPAAISPFHICSGCNNVGNTPWGHSPVLNNPNIPMICMPMPIPVPVAMPCQCNRFGARFVPSIRTTEELGNSNADITQDISALPADSQDKETLENRQKSPEVKSSNIEARHVTVVTSSKYRRKRATRKKNAIPILLNQTIERSEHTNRVAQCIQKLAEIISNDDRDKVPSDHEKSQNAEVAGQTVDTDCTNGNSDVADDEDINPGNEADNAARSISTIDPLPINGRDSDDTDDCLDMVDSDMFENDENIETVEILSTLIAAESSDLRKDLKADSIIAQQKRELYRCGNELDNSNDLVHQLVSKKSIELQVEAVLRETSLPLRIVIAPKSATEIEGGAENEENAAIQPEESNTPVINEDEKALSEGTASKQAEDIGLAAASGTTLSPHKPAEHPKSPQKTIFTPKRSSPKLLQSTNSKKSPQRTAQPLNKKNRPTARKSSTHIKNDACTSPSRSPPALSDPFLYVAVKDVLSAVPPSRPDKKSPSHSTTSHKQTTGSRVSSPELGAGSTSVRCARIVTPREGDARALAAVQKKSWSRLTRTGRDALSRAVREHRDSDDVPEHFEHACTINDCGAESENQGLCLFSAPRHFGSPSPSPVRALYRPPATGSRLSRTPSIDFNDESASARTRAPSRLGKPFVPLSRENIQSEIAAAHLERSVQMLEPPQWKTPRVYRQPNRMPKFDYTGVSQRGGSQQSTIQRDRQIQKSDPMSRKQKRSPLPKPRSPKSQSRGGGRPSVVSSPDIRAKKFPPSKQGGMIWKEPTKARDAQRLYCEDHQQNNVGGARPVRAATRGDAAERPARRQRTISEAGASARSTAHTSKLGTTGALYRRTTGARQPSTGPLIATPSRPPPLPPNPQAPPISQPVLKLGKAPSAPSLTSISPPSLRLPNDASLLAQPAPLPPSPTPSSSFSPSITSVPETSPSISVSPSPSTPSLSPVSSPTPSDYCTSISAASKAAKNEPAYKYLMDLMNKTQDDSNNPDSRTVFITGASIRTLSCGQTEDGKTSWPARTRPSVALQKQLSALQLCASALQEESRVSDKNREISGQSESPTQRASPSSRRSMLRKAEQGKPKNGTRGGAIGGRDASDATIAATGAATRSPARVFASLSYSLLQVSQSGPIESTAGAGDYAHQLPTRTHSTPLQVHLVARADSCDGSREPNPCSGESSDGARLSDLHNSAPAKLGETTKEPCLLTRKRYSADDLCVRGTAATARSSGKEAKSSPLTASHRGRRMRKKVLGSRRSVMLALETVVKAAAIA